MAKALIKFDSLPWKHFIKRAFDRSINNASLLKLAFMTYGFADIDDHFEKQMGPKKKWKKRTPATNKQYDRIRSGKGKAPLTSRAQYNSSNKILQMTGKLRQSILPESIRQVGRNSIRIFSNDDHSKIHDMGGKFKAWGHEAKMPKRKFMWASKSAKEKMQDMMVRIILHGA